MNYTMPKMLVLSLLEYIVSWTWTIHWWKCWYFHCWRIYVWWPREHFKIWCL